MNPTESPPAAAASADDHRLVAACLASEPQAWIEFVDRFSDLFVHVVDGTAADRSVRWSPAERLDTVVEIMGACVQDEAAVLRGFAGRASLATYLAVIARRVAVRSLLRRPGGDRTAAAEACDVAPGAGAERDQGASSMQRLDGDEAILIRLHHLEGRSYGEISRITGMPLGAIGPALSRAKAKMRG